MLDELTRKRERGRGREVLDGLLDEVLVGTLSTVVDGLPWSVPLMYARLGDRIVLHGSTGAGALRHVAAGAPVTFTVFTIDALVVAATAFDSSANYRSAVIRGELTQLDGEERLEALEVFTNRVIPGRTGEVPALTRQELAATLVLALPITDGNWLCKTRDAGAAEIETGAWTGIVPLRTVASDPVPDPVVPSGTPAPASVLALVERLS